MNAQVNFIQLPQCFSASKYHTMFSFFEHVNELSVSKKKEGIVLPRQ
jgi:hypothetical protein